MRVKPTMMAYLYEPGGREFESLQARHSSHSSRGRCTCHLSTAAKSRFADRLLLQMTVATWQARLPNAFWKCGSLRGRSGPFPSKQMLNPDYKEMTRFG